LTKLEPQATILLLLSTLSRREEKVIRLRDGLGGGTRRTYEEISTIFKISPKTARVIEARARQKLQKHFDSLKEKSHDEILEKIVTPEVDDQQISRIELAVACFNKLTPELIDHIQNNNGDINELSWQVVEHLVAELLAQQGFEDVRLVGRSSETGADIYACKNISGVGTQIRYYVEVKHTRGSVGIDKVRVLYGALTDERADFGWNGGILVTSGKIANFRRGERASWELKGVAMRDREDLCKWLSDYHPNSCGLWLPNPLTGMPQSIGNDRTR